MSNIIKRWRVGTHDPRVVFDAHGNEVVTVHGHFDDAVPRARLIAAAPGLLVVCEDIKKYLDFVSSGQPTHGTVERELYYRLQAAISDAKGE